MLASFLVHVVFAKLRVQVILYYTKGFLYMYVIIFILSPILKMTVSCKTGK